MSEIIKVLNRASSALSNVMQRHPGYEFSELRILLAGAVGSVATLEEDNARMKAELEAVGAGGVQSLRKCNKLHQIAEPASNLASELADMLERSITGLGHYRNSQNWSEADEEHINECNALLDRFACADDEREAAPQAVQADTPLPMIKLVGVKDGQETSLGQVPMPPTMRARELLHDVGFTGLDDDDGDGAYAMGVCEQLIEYCKAYYEAPTHSAEGVPAQEVTKVQQTAPKVIHLNIGPDAEDCDFKDLYDVTWCDHDATNGSIQYVRADLSATHPTQQELDAPSEAARSVLSERARQIAAEGYTPEQDDGYNPGVLALHGGLYACHAYDNLAKKRAPEGWQWDAKWWKSKDPRSNLVKAGALILAEIERMDRSFAAKANQGEQANG